MTIGAIYGTSDRICIKINDNLNVENSNVITKFARAIEVKLVSTMIKSMKRKETFVRTGEI
jgi:hypothetical protein